MSSWEWCDYETYCWLYYNNPGKYLVGALIEDGRVRTKWGTSPFGKPVINERARAIIDEIRREQSYTGPAGVHVVTYDMLESLAAMQPKQKAEPKPRKPTERKTKAPSDARTGKLFDDK